MQIDLKKTSIQLKKINYSCSEGIAMVGPCCSLKEGIAQETLGALVQGRNDCEQCLYAGGLALCKETFGNKVMQSRSLERSNFLSIDDTQGASQLPLHT